MKLVFSLQVSDFNLISYVSDLFHGENNSFRIECVVYEKRLILLFYMENSIVPICHELFIVFDQYYWQT